MLTAGERVRQRLVFEGRVIRLLIVCLRKTLVRQLVRAPSFFDSLKRRGLTRKRKARSLPSALIHAERGLKPGKRQASGRLQYGWCVCLCFLCVQGGDPA